MTLIALSQKYYEFLAKFYTNINNDRIKWSKPVNADYYTAELDYKYKIRIHMKVEGLVKSYYLRMFDDANSRLMEITTKQHGSDKILIDGKLFKVQEILEEIYEWAKAYSMDIIGKIDQAANYLDKIKADKD